MGLSATVPHASPIEKIAVSLGIIACPPFPPSWPLKTQFAKQQRIKRGDISPLTINKIQIWIKPFSVSSC